ncbi:MAG: cytochrome c oxidase subunit 3, partial [Actinomycetota bacterium]|nr:cytochrome c oxidase subunit 3 [Actinomycetota bacterium]
YNLISTIGVLAFIVPGIGVFVWNLVRSLRRGERAGANPWGAGTLEWAVPSPPAQHGWTILPIVHGRYPLWDQDELHRGAPTMERFVRSLAEWPLRWRAGVIVGTADAQPQEVFRVAKPSIWPLIAAAGVVLIFLAELTKLRWAIGAGVVVVVAAVIGWNRPEEPPMTVEEEDAFERANHVPVNAAGSVVVAAWATGTAILFLAIAFGSLLLSYFYLRLENPQWPPPGIAEPAFTLVALAATLVVVAVAALRFALRRLGASDQRGFVGGLVLALVLACAGVVVQYIDAAGMGFGVGTHAYGSIFHTLTGFLVVLAGGAIIALSMVLWWTLRGQYTVRRYATVRNVVRLYTAVAVMWVVGFATLYMGPYLT